MKVLVTGATGQLGTDVVKSLTAQNIETYGLSHTELDITDKQNVRKVFEEIKPDVVIHCAAYTAVDLAEEQVEVCNRINVEGTRNIVKACLDSNCKLVYVSTDYVFEGNGTKPWETTDRCMPLNVYGNSKLLGEQLVQETLTKYFIVRTAWAFGRSGKNFVKTMLRLSETKQQISVVQDQIGSPTFTEDLAELIVEMIQTDRYGIYHATNTGYCSWYEFACEIFHQAKREITVLPISSEEYPSKAIRPKNSRLSQKSLEENGFTCLPTWRDALKRYLEE